MSIPLVNSIASWFLKKRKHQNHFKAMNKTDSKKIISLELNGISNEDIARIQLLLEKLAIIEYETYKEAV